MLITNHFLVFEIEDGGGGPQTIMLEKLRRCRRVSDTIGSLPRVSTGTSVEDFFDRRSAETNSGKDLATWNGELYLEIYRARIGC